MQHLREGHEITWLIFYQYYLIDFIKAQSCFVPYCRLSIISSEVWCIFRSGGCCAWLNTHNLFFFGGWGLGGKGAIIHLGYYWTCTPATFPWIYQAQMIQTMYIDKQTTRISCWVIGLWFAGLEWCNCCQNIGAKKHRDMSLCVNIAWSPAPSSAENDLKISWLPGIGPITMHIAIHSSPSNLAYQNKKLIYRSAREGTCMAMA